MSNRDLDLNEAKRIFLTMVIAHSYKGAIKMMADYLEDNKKRPVDIVELREWFAGLDDKNRQRVRSIIEKTADGAVFNFLVFLDGLAGGYPLQDKPSDFALYLQEYESDELLWKETAKAGIRLNSPQGSDYLHEIYTEMVEEQDNIKGA